MSAQTDVGDLLGGYRPAPARRIAIELYKELISDLFPSIFDAEKNAKFLDSLSSALNVKNYPRLAAGMGRAQQLALDKVDAGHTQTPQQRMQWSRWGNEL